MSDGYPTFESSAFLYKGKNALLDTAKAVHNIKKKGVKVLSYFINTPTNDYREKELMDNFKIMYGKEASFINPNNINEITKTLNNLFLQKDLIS
jgi:nitric oxide reductase activation protein